jgi:hypothetical protein
MSNFFFGNIKNIVVQHSKSFFTNLKWSSFLDKTEIKMVFDYLDFRCHFHQHFLSAFLLIFWRQNFQSWAKHFCTKFWRQKCAYVRKICTFNVDEIDYRTATPFRVHHFSQVSSDCLTIKFSFK